MIPVAQPASARKRQRAVQDRTVVTRARIIDGAIAVLAREGVRGLTHRAVAVAAGVSLSATTYHFDTKADIIEAASRTLLDGYLAAFRRMARRVEAGEETRIARIDDLVERVARNALGRDRVRSLAWSELILHGGRSVHGRALARNWYEELDALWYAIAQLVAPRASRQMASAAIDRTVGLTFILHPLGLGERTVTDVLAGRTALRSLLVRQARSRRKAEPDDQPAGRHAETRQRVVQSAIDIIVREGAAGISYGRVAEVAGMVRSGPGYYFDSIEDLIDTAEGTLFARARTRFQSAIGTANAAETDEARLLDLATTIFFREALEFGSENIGFYSVWISAAANTALRPAVAAALRDMLNAWSERILPPSTAASDPAAALRLQALFVGKLIRAIAASVPVAELARAREDFALALHPDRGRSAR
jgi:AcrR family transcriptional regulator